jgi:hypothetical protein
LLIISFVHIFKKGITTDHWNIFIMRREKNDLGEMEPGNLTEAGPINLGGVGTWPNNLGG